MPVELRVYPATAKIYRFLEKDDGTTEVRVMVFFLRTSVEEARDYLNQSDMWHKCTPEEEHEALRLRAQNKGAVITS